jgi:pyrimidine operon attenuation protein/uracil phosphoribosyltransferase
MQHDAIMDLIDGMGRTLGRQLDERDIEQPAVVGIHTGGAWVAQHLHRQLDCQDPLGLLDISFYRDDFTRIGVNPQVRPSQIDFDLEGRDIVLVDDVIQSGRTIRAAMNELFDYGRPRSIVLACLVERDGRQLPIQPDVVGLRLPLPDNEHIRLTGPEPYSFILTRLQQD